MTPIIDDGDILISSKLHKYLNLINSNDIITFFQDNKSK